MSRVANVMFCALFAAEAIASAQTAAKSADSPWKKLEFLLGAWTANVGEKDTPLGPGHGAASYQLDLSGKVIVRHNYAQYDSGQRHDDLMVIYLDTPGDIPKAIYFDSEGHIIRYNLAFPSANTVVFESDGTQPGPRYRLTQWLEGGALLGKFELAMRGGPYKTYMSWSSKKS